MLNVLQHINLMKHGLGATPTAALDLYEVFNRAGRYLYNYAEWSWRMRNTTLATVAGDEKVPLPAGYEQLVSLQIPGATPSAQIRLTDLTTLHRARTGEMVVVSGYLICIPPTHLFDNTTGALTARYAILYPVPTLNGTPALDLWYRAAWTEVAIANNAHFPRIPPEFEEALICLARDGAIALQDQSVSLEGSRANTMLAKLQEVDAERQQVMGRMHGGAGDRRNRSRIDPIVNPSLTL